MSAEFIWTVPTRGDGRRAQIDEWNRGDWHLGLPTSPDWVLDHRRGTFDPYDYLEAIIVAAEHGGFDDLLVPFDLEGEESWIVSAVAARQTRWIRSIIEFSPSITTPVYAAKMTATLGHAVGGRVDWKLAIEFDDGEANAHGDQLRGHDRYIRAEEFLTIAKSVWRNKNVNIDGSFYSVDDGGLEDPLNVHEFPRVILFGESEEAIEFGAKHADIYVLDATDDIRLTENISSLTKEAKTAGRSPQIAVELSIIAREDDFEAWDRVQRLRGERGHAGEVLRDLSSARWNGFDQIGYSSPAGLVGSYEQAKEALEEYRNRGIDVFIFNGYPNVEEAYRVGQHVLSLFSTPVLTSH